MRPVTVTVGPLASAVANNIALAQSPTAAAGFTLNGSLVSGGVATLDVARRVLFTTSGNESANHFTIYGTDVAGNTITDVVAGANIGTSYSALDFKTVTSIAITVNAAANITVGTNGVASSPWVRLDNWAFPQVSIQCTVGGTVNYTVQQTLDDPNSATNAVLPYLVTWVSSSDTNVVGATTTQQSNYAFAPIFARVLLNSGTGTVVGTFSQAGNAPV